MIKKNALKIIFALCVVTVLLVAAGCLYWRLPPAQFSILGMRTLVSRGLGVIFSDDLEQVAGETVHYYHGDFSLVRNVPDVSWRFFEKEIPGFSFLSYSGPSKFPEKTIPFYYEDPRAPYLVALRKKYRLDSISASRSDEFSAMLLLAEWVGTRWDHGVDPLPEEGKYDPLAILSKSEQGSSYWCEVAAIVMVQVAASMGWPARLVTASRDGYRWEHAVAELWSNQFEKWFVIDADYNIFYMADGKPLSAYELCHFGPTLQLKGKLQVKQFAPMKPSLKLQDLLPYYRYVHIDLRNDWFSRKLRRGSPAGGDLATWWTARSDLGPILTAKVHVRDQALFDWPVNVVTIYPGDVSRVNGRGHSVLNVTLAGYSPYFKNFQVAVDDAGFKSLQGDTFQVNLQPGRHCLKARLLTLAGNSGPISSVCFEFEQ